MARGMAALVRTDAAAALVGVRCGVNSRGSCGPHLTAAVAPSAALRRRFQPLTSFSGQKKLTRHLRHCPPSVQRRKKRGSVVAESGVPPGSTSPRSLGAENILHDVSRFFYFRTKSVINAVVPKDFDLLFWLPEGPHDWVVHNIEVPAIILLREILHFSIFYVLFKKVDSLCRWFNWLYNSSPAARKDPTEDGYETSSFKAMTEPLQLVIVVWALTRIAHVTAPLLKLDLDLHSNAKIRLVGLIVAVTWFFLKWKEIYVGKLATTYRLDAPRIFAFDKVVSLLVYFVAVSSGAEVTGFALRSLLAVGGFSGVALGLAAKEIVSNFFGGAALFVTRPFVVGEWIKTGQISGHVQDIGFLQTKVLSADRVPMVVPNQNFTNEVIINYSRALNKLMEAEFSLRAQDIFLVHKITSATVSYLRSHPDVDASNSTPVCYLKSVSPSNCHLAVACVLRPAGGSEFFRVQQAILVHVAEIIVGEGAMIGSNGQFGNTIPALEVPP